MNYPPPRDLLRDKVVLVTAAAGTGIGSALARRCAEEGATVVISDIHSGRLARTADALVELQGTASVHWANCPVSRQDKSFE